MPELKELYRTPVAEAHPAEITVTVGDRPIVYRKATWSYDGQDVALRYGENPHQPAAFYAPAEGVGAMSRLTWVKLGKGGPSWINLADMDHALRILKYLNRPAVAVMKHLNPAGVAEQHTTEALAEIYAAARACDERASFGGVVAFNRVVDGQTARELTGTFIEAVVAPDYTEEAIALLSEKRDLRVARVDGIDELPRFEGDAAGFDLKVLNDGSILLQRPYLTRIRSVADLVQQPVVGQGHDAVRVEHKPTPSELADLLFAWYVNTGVRSNGIVIAKHGRTLAVGTGEQERVGAVEQAIHKARSKGHDLRDSVVSSDAFFPFRDSVDALAAAGVRAIVQPGGSLRDAEVARACNEQNIAMVFTHERCFAHF